MYCAKLKVIINVGEAMPMSTKYISPANIESIATQMRTDFLSNQPVLNEVDINTIAHGLGCDIELVDFNLPNISAQVLRRDGDSGGYTIQLSRGDNPRRQKFSVAHEIAHIVLHDDGKSNFIELRQSLIEYDEKALYKEVQANMLASALLLPADQVRSIWDSSKSVDLISETFNVSYQAAYNRLDNLGLLINE